MGTKGLSNIELLHAKEYFLNGEKSSTPTVHASASFENLFDKFVRRSSAHADIIRLVTLVDHCYLSALLRNELDNIVLEAYTLTNTGPRQRFTP